MKKRICVFICCWVAVSSFAQFRVLNNGSARVEETLKKLTLEEKIAQLITIRSNAQGDSAYFAEIAKTVRKYGVGGVCFFKGTPHGLMQAANLYQSSAKIPLLVSIDGEWGVAMRLDSVVAFPRQQTLGALQDDYLVYQMGELVAEQCKRLGIHINFVPCVDVNSNPKNPVINTRSFGESRVNVANKGIAYMTGLQSKNVLASAKHFPGHGDTETDSHLDLPQIKHPLKRIDSIDLFPFKMLIKNGVWSVMIGHLNIPAMDHSPYPSSVSKFIVDTLLKRDLKFKGLIFTDGLEMNAFAKYGSNGEMELRAVMAGADNLLLPVSTEKTIETIAKAVRSGLLNEEIINDKCRKILYVKYKQGLLKQTPFISSKNLMQDLNNAKIDQLNKKIYSEAITVLENKNEILPINPDKYKHVANLNIGDVSSNVFQQVVDKYTPSTSYNLPRDFSEKLIDSIVQTFSKDDLLIVSITNTNINADRNYGVTPQTIRLIEKLADLDNAMVLTIFASPYVLSSFSKNLSVDGLVIAYQEQQEAQEIAAHGIFGANALAGRLPVTASKQYPSFSGLALKPKRQPVVINRFTINARPPFFGVDDRLQKLIADTVFPGCQVLVAKDGQIVYNKAFGTHTYNDTLTVKTTDLYDVASVTKVAATTLALMKLYDEKKFKLDDKLSTYLPYLKRSNKANITIREVLAHQAGLQPSVHTHKRAGLFTTRINPKFPVKVASNFYTS
ncbi:MAG: serine hydrolase, partial [Bacteroidales bacterium]|nr:serine hydrolase [Bacteroidales bacterium]